MKIHRLALALLVLAASTAGCRDQPVDPTPICSVTIDPALRSFASGTETGTITITTSAATCDWTASTTTTWITITAGASGTGPGTVAYSVAANTTTGARSGTVVVSGQTHTVNQEGRPPDSCTFALTPTTVSLGNAGGSGSFSVGTAAGCTWSAASAAPWLSVTSGGTGSGSGTVSYRADPNPSVTVRTGTILAGGQSFVVTQSGQPAAQCEFTVSPVTFTPCMPAGTVVARLTTSPACSWTATSRADWLTVTSAAAGTGTVDITVAHGENYDAPRQGVVEIRWPTPTAGQNLQIAQAGCLYGVSRSTFSFAAGGGSSSFDVLQQSVPNSCGGALQDRCRWTAVSNVPWITITSPMPRTGDNPVAFSVTANSTGAARTGTITVRDRVVQITQAGS